MILLAQGLKPGNQTCKSCIHKFEPSNFTEAYKLMCQHDLSVLHPGQEPISWADLIVLSAKVAHVLAWTQQKVKRATVASGGSTIADAFGAAFPVPLGRVDATSADEPVKIPTQSASPAEIKVREGEGSIANRACACCHISMASSNYNAQHMQHVTCPVLSLTFYVHPELSPLAGKSANFIAVTIIVTYYNPPTPDDASYMGLMLAHFSISCHLLVHPRDQYQLTLICVHLLGIMKPEICALLVLVLFKCAVLASKTCCSKCACRKQQIYWRHMPWL